MYGIIGVFGNPPYELAGSRYHQPILSRLVKQTEYCTDTLYMTRPNGAVRVRLCGRYSRPQCIECRIDGPEAVARATQSSDPDHPGGRFYKPLGPTYKGSLGAYVISSALSCLSRLYIRYRAQYTMTVAS